MELNERQKRILREVEEREERERKEDHNRDLIPGFDDGEPLRDY